MSGSSLSNFPNLLDISIRIESASHTDPAIREDLCITAAETSDENDESHKSNKEMPFHEGFSLESCLAEWGNKLTLGSNSTSSRGDPVILSLPQTLVGT
jgi:hypothetical protein